MNLEFLGKKFDEEIFIDFIGKAFEDFEFLDTAYNDKDLTDKDKEHILRYKNIGETMLKDNSEVAVLFLESATPQIENKGIGFANIISKLSQPLQKEITLVIIYHKNSPVWRLTFISFDFKGGKQIQRSDSKRYSYVLGEEIAIKTAISRVGLLFDGQHNTQETIEEIFNVDKVSKEFFAKYKKLYFETLEALRPQVAIFGTEKDLELFSKKLMGRITFLYFLQKKGWLGAKKNWEDGNKRFLTQCFEGKYKEYENFYDDILKRIFFEALNRDRSEYNDSFEPFGKMPYLNGGLFAKKDIDNDNRLMIENDIFENIITTFDQYNFTIIEDTPHESEVAIDPEMLGKVFENLLVDRKEKGAFYTPREIVHYMCQTSLNNYLQTKPKDESDLEYIKKIKILDPAIGSGAFPMGMLHEILEKRITLGDTQDISSMKREIIENAIYGIDIEPSAVEIAKLRFWLSIVVDENTPSPLPNLFYKIMVGNSLLETINGFDPLDKSTKSINNLQPKLHHYYREKNANNKSTLEEEIEKDIDTILDEKISKYKKEKEREAKNINLFNQLSKKQLETIEKANRDIDLIDKVKKRPTTELFFYKLYFKEVMDDGGFDVVIGNPPYVRHEKIKAIKERLKIEGYKSYSGTADLYIYFFEQGYRLLKENGVLSYITSNTYVNARYAEKFREFIVNDVNVLNYIDFSKVQLFDSATVATSIFMFSKQNRKYKYFNYCDAKEYTKDKILQEFVSKNNFDYLQSDLRKEGFIFTSKKELEIKKAIDKKGIKLKDESWEIQIKSGIKTGFNEAFIIDTKTKNKLIEEDPKSAEIIKPILRGRDVKKYDYEFADKWLINSHNNPPIDISKYPAIKEHLDKYYDRLERRSDKGVTPYNLRNCAYLDEFTKNKIMWLELTDNAKFTLDVKKYFLEMTVFFMTGKDLKYLLALLNSRLIYWYFNLICAESGVGTNRWKKIYVEQLPIIQISKEAQKPFEILVDYVMFAKENEMNIEASYFESVIDGLVYDLYFEEEMKKGDCFITEEVTKVIKELNPTQEYIKDMYKLFKNNRDIQRGIIYRRVISVVKVINGGNK
jgi:NOL1/NOP2/fmu family ribosome biogenesis protein